MANDLIASMVLAIWLYLLAGRGGFWLANERDDRNQQQSGRSDGSWPTVAAIIPARDEAESIGGAIASLLRQDYGGKFDIILVDDGSSDATAQIARETALALGAGDRVAVLPGKALPDGWTGKLWAQYQGVECAENTSRPPAYLLLTDADIVYAPDALSSLVARAQAGGLALTSLMAKLRCKSLSERMFIPAFIFFFQMLYPFSWVNDRRRASAAAAGGCMLVHADALRQAGGIETIRDSLIDDCALARRLKRHGPISLTLTERAHSVRFYPFVRDIRQMVSRTAYAQLRYSPLLLAGTILALAITFLAPVGLTFFAAGMAQSAGIFAWLLLAFAFRPTLRFYGLSELWAPALPAIAALYMAFTLDSAYQHVRGRGGMWKGRAQGNVSELR